MSNIIGVFEQQKTPEVSKDYLQYLARVLFRSWNQLARIVNGGLQMYYVSASGSLTPGNIQGFLYNGPIAAPTQVITHNLGYVPQGFITLSQSSSASLFLSAATNTTAVIGTPSALTNAKLLII